jgi:hypothetical protein
MCGYVSIAAYGRRDQEQHEAVANPVRKRTSATFIDRFESQ